MQVLHRLLIVLNGLGGKDVTLGIEQFADMLAHVRRVAHGAGNKPAEVHAFFSGCVRCCSGRISKMKAMRSVGRATPFPSNAGSASHQSRRIRDWVRSEEHTSEL